MDHEAQVEAVRIRLGEKGLCVRCRRRWIDGLNGRRTKVGYVCANRKACRLALQSQKESEATTVARASRN